MHIEKAYYGRIELGKCISQNLGFMPCYKDVTSVIQDTCGMNSPTCTIPRYHMIIKGHTSNCSSSVMSHLYIKAACVIKQESTVPTTDYSMNTSNSIMTKDFCASEKFEHACAEDYSLKIHSAFWGRMELGRCVPQNLGHLGCKKDVTEIVKEMCDSKPKCSFWQHVLYQRTSPSCNLNVQQYLQVKLQCVMNPSVMSTIIPASTALPAISGRSAF